MHHFEELVLADDENVLVLRGRVFLGVISRFGRYSAAVEHPLVALHGDGKLLHVFWFESAFVNLLLEFQSCGSDGSRSLGRVPSPSVISVRVEVADIWHNWVPMCEICCIIPPFVDPVLLLRVLPSGK